MATVVLYYVNIEKKVVHEVVIQKKISTFARLLPCNDAACRREGWGQLIFY